MKRLVNNDYGMTAAFFAMLLVVFISILGLVIDGGIMILSKRQLSSASEAAIRSVVKSYDMDKWENEGIIILDEIYARALAEEYLSQNFKKAYIDSFAIHSDQQNKAIMTTKYKVQFIFMKIFGLDEKNVTTTVTCEVG